MSKMNLIKVIQTVFCALVVLMSVGCEKEQAAIYESREHGFSFRILNELEVLEDNNSSIYLELPASRWKDYSVSSVSILVEEISPSEVESKLAPFELRKKDAIHYLESYQFDWNGRLSLWTTYTVPKYPDQLNVQVCTVSKNKYYDIVFRASKRSRHESKEEIKLFIDNFEID